MDTKKNEKQTSERLNMFMEQLNKRSIRETAAMNVIRMLATHLQDGGEIPRSLALSIGGCLEDYVDIDGRCSDPDIQLLHREIVRIAGW